jgi:hypothetical protein
VELVVARSLHIGLDVPIRYLLHHIVDLQPQAVHANHTLGLRLDALGQRVLLEVIRFHEGLQVLVLDLPEPQRYQESRTPNSLQIEQCELDED